MIDIGSQKVVRVPLRSITVSKSNIRSYFDPDTIEDLSRSIRKVGQIHPVLLRRLPAPSENKYELIAGSRRFKAMWKSNRPNIAAIVLDDAPNPAEIVILSLTENVHTQNLTPFEEARAFLLLCKDYGFSQKEVATRLGKTIAFVKNRLKLLSVPDPVQDLLCKRKVTINHVGIIASLSNPKDQIRYAKVVSKESLSEEDLTTMIREESKNKGTTMPKDPATIKLFTPMRSALKVKRFSRFLVDKIRPQLLLWGPEVAEIRSALREVRDLIDAMLRKKNFE